VKKPSPRFDRRFCIIAWLHHTECDGYFGFLKDRAAASRNEHLIANEMQSYGLGQVNLVIKMAPHCVTNIFTQFDDRITLGYDRLAKRTRIVSAVWVFFSKK
jgi:hypothetical protein